MTEEPILTSDKVEAIMKDCLFRKEEIEDGKPKEPNMMVQVEGCVHNFGLHKVRLESHREEIIVLLKELPDEFHKNVGGGWSFLNSCNDRHGNQWTGLHRTMEELFVLGIAVGKASWQMKELALTLPGGMPYAIIDVE